jgi:VanZ family protein
MVATGLFGYDDIPQTALGLLAVALTLLNEALQHFAAHRDASWHDLGIDMAVVDVVLARVGMPLSE